MPTSRLEAAVRTIIRAACQHHEPVDRDGLIDTPRRVSKAWLAMAAAHAPITRSLSTNSMDSSSALPSDIIRSALFDEPDVGGLGFVLVKDITFACLNRNTLLPMYGKCHVAYVPKSGTIIGLSKLSRVVSSVCSRSLLSPHELCQSVIDMIADFSGGVGVVVSSNYGVFSGNDGLDGPLFDELLVLVDGEGSLRIMDEKLAAMGTTAPAEGIPTNIVHVQNDEQTERHATIASAVGTLLEGIGEDATSTSNLCSARSYASWFLDATSGYYQDENDDVGDLNVPAVVANGHARGNDEETNGAGMDNSTLALAIPFTSQCEHHLLPFEGHVGVMLVGVRSNAESADAKLRARVEKICAYHVSRFSKRLQVQERLTQQIANVLWERLRPLCDHVVVLIECKHLCMIARGVQQHCSATVTQTVRSSDDGNGDEHDGRNGLGQRRLACMRMLKQKIISASKHAV